MQLKNIAIYLTNVLYLPQLLQVSFQINELIVLSEVVRENGDSICQLVEIRKGRVVHQNYLREIPPNDAQILGIDLAVELDTVLSIQSMLNEFVLRIDLIQNSVSV